MAVKEVVPGIYEIPLGIANAFLIADRDLTLIDTGAAGNADKILAVVRQIGRQPADVRHILVTHSHQDHSGSLAALKRATGAPAYMHPADAALVRQGRATRGLKPPPGLLNWLLYQYYVRPVPTTVEPAEIECEVGDGEELPIAGGIKAIHAPGHCAGQLVFLLPRKRLLFAADVAGNVVRLQLSLGYEDLTEGKRTLARLCTLDFDVACFGHGSALTEEASTRFRDKFGQWS